jgi:hypothetical protein
MSRIGCLDIEIYDINEDDWVQGKYLVHGYRDVLWTNDLDAAMLFMRESVVAISIKKETNNAKVSA